MHRLKKVFSAKKRRGLATVVTTAILLSAVSIMGVSLLGWANSSLQTKQLEQSTLVNDRMNKLNEDLLVENIWFGTSPNIVNLTLNNYGAVGFNITSIEIENSTGYLYFTITDGGLAPSDGYSFQKPFTWNSGETTDFTIITERGNIFTSQEVT